MGKSGEMISYCEISLSNSQYLTKVSPRNDFFIKNYQKIIFIAIFHTCHIIFVVSIVADFRGGKLIIIHCHELTLHFFVCLQLDIRSNWFQITYRYSNQTVRRRSEAPPHQPLAAPLFLCFEISLAVFLSPSARKFSQSS